ncbi:MAG: Nif3-like dinuclear metal center hexameric protein [Longimicrobiales bacterium]
MSVPLTDVVTFLDDYLRVEQTPDYPTAMNGLQVGGQGPVTQFAVAVDASETIIDSVKEWADLLIVHHGLFWGGLQPVTGPLYRKVKALVESNTALYSVHLPLDRHAEVGNAAVLARELGMKALEPFGEYQGISIGWRGRLHEPLEGLQARLAALVGGEVRVLPGGPDPVQRVAVVTGGGASFIKEAASEGIDALITGEAQHHHAIESQELGVSTLLGGHYATETWGVKELSTLLKDRFQIDGLFVDAPTGL